jgi:PAS domain S-box-containing protein
LSGPRVSTRILHGESKRLAIAWNPYTIESLLHSVLANLPLPTYVCDDAGLIMFFNDAAKSLWGREPKLNDPVDRYCGSLRMFLPDGSPIAHDQAWVASALRDNKPHHGYEFAIERPDGSKASVLGNANPYRDETGKPRGAANVLVDITGRRQPESAAHREISRLLSQWAAAEIERRRNEETLARDSLILRNIRDSVVLTDADGVIVYWNDGASRLFGWTAIEMVGRPYADRLPEPMRIWIAEQIRQRAEGPEWVGEYEDRRKDGTPIWISARIRRMTDPRGQCVGILGLAFDISEHKRAEVDRALLAAIIESSLDAIISKDLDGIITTWNAGAERLFGYSAEEIVGRSIDTIVPANRQAEEDDILRSIRSGKRVELFETVRRRKDGSLVDVTVAVSPIRDAAGEVVGASKIAHDITTKKEADEKLRQSEHRLAEAQRVAQIGSWERDLRTNQVTWSNETYLLFRAKPSDGRTFESFLAYLHPEDVPGIIEGVERALRERLPFELEYRVTTADGEVVVLRDRGEAVFDEAGEPRRLVGTVQDITVRKRNEEERESLHRQVLKSREELRHLSRRLLQAQEEERRALARELHDEIGQVLTAVSLSLDLTKSTVDEAKRGRLEESIAVVDLAIDQVRSLSLNLRPAMLDVMGLDSALRWLIGRQSAATGLRIEFASDLGGERIATELETACYRIVQESLTNVVRHARARTVRIRILLFETELLLTIEDDGIGFDAAAARLRATTGASFGLLGMEERVHLLDGAFEIVSAIGTGTAVRARLPSGGNAPRPQPEMTHENDSRTPGR